MQFKDCIRDPHCEFEVATASCKAPDVAYAPGARAGLRVHSITAPFYTLSLHPQALIAGSAAPGDKDLMFKILDCNEGMTKETCPGHSETISSSP